jgi:hypothetical protein
MQQIKAIFSCEPKHGMKEQKKREELEPSAIKYTY